MRVITAGSRTAPRAWRRSARSRTTPTRTSFQCHPCGDWFRFVAASHVRWHGWTLDEYREAFHLLKRTSTAAAGVSDKLRRNAIARRETNERWANPPRASGPRPGARRSSLAIPRGPPPRPRRPAASHLQPRPKPVRAGPWIDAAGLVALRRLRLRVARLDSPRSRGAGCRQCTRPAWRVPSERSLALLRPDLAAELHPTRNGDLDPYELGAGSQRRLWWPAAAAGTSGARRSRADRARATAALNAPARTGRSRRRVPRERSLAVLHPDLANELHPTRNGDLDPYQVAPTSRRSVWWRCDACGHEWRALLSTRARGHGCPECHRLASIGRRRPVARERSLAVLRPDLAAELQPTRNGDLDAFTVARWSVQPVWWRCASCGHDWRVTPQDRAGCSRCSARRPVARERSLAVLRPDLGAELHPTRNGDLDPCALARAPIRRCGGSAATAGGNGGRASPPALAAAAGCPSCAKRRGALKRWPSQPTEPSRRPTD